jgi:hypothetical protein
MAKMAYMDKLTDAGVKAMAKITNQYKPGQ